jgi:redox-sensing transcriptional repressor
MKPIPEPSRKRLVLLAQLLAQQTTEKITSVTIEELTGWSPSLIRRDISLLEIRCGASNGYKVQELRTAICTALDISATITAVRKCCIVGLGRLGSALLENSIFENSGFRIAAGFDSNVNRTEVLRSTFPLHPLSRLEVIVASEQIEFAVLAVPDKDAQQTAVRLCACGIHGIVNYTGIVLSLPDRVAVENVSPVTAMTNLAAKTAVSIR